MTPSVMLNTVKLGGEGRGARELDEDVIALSHVVDGIGQTALAPFGNIGDFAVLLDQGLELFNDRLDSLFPKGQIDNEESLVLSGNFGHVSAPPFGLMAGAAKRRQG